MAEYSRPNSHRNPGRIPTEFPAEFPPTKETPEMGGGCPDLPHFDDGLGRSSHPTSDCRLRGFSGQCQAAMIGASTAVIRVREHRITRDQRL